MPILGDATVVIARLARSTSNTLRVQLTTPDDTELAHAQQKGGVAVLLGYKNGGKSNYTLSNPVGDELRIAVGKTTTVTRQNTPIGKIVPADGAVRFESGGGTVLAVVQPHSGSKADSAWHHRILSPAGDELGVLTLMRAQNGWTGIAAETSLWLLNENVGALKAPSAGALLKLRAPVAPEVGDVLAAACIDFSVLPRGYIA
jgi:antitoxin (DNA-binding transcriptional repressor) of toxin-antitoxin stability system